MSAETYLLYLAAVAVFFATPPDTSQLLVVANAMRHGVRRTVWVIVGDLTANTVQMTAAAFGLAALIATSATAFVLIKWCGVAYLVWIGLRMMWASGAQAEAQAAQAARPGRLFRLGFVTSMTNPFAVVFFAALFPQFLTAQAPVLPQLLLLGATYLVVDGATLLLWGWAGDRVAARFAGGAMRHVHRLCGGLMIGAAVLLGLKDITPQR